MFREGVLEENMGESLAFVILGLKKSYLCESASLVFYFLFLGC